MGSEPGKDSGPSSRRADSGGWTAAADLVSARDRLLDAGEPGAGRLDAAQLRAALVDLYEQWLTEKGTELGITANSGLALLAVGGLGRGEMLPYSDLDLVLLHEDVAPSVLAEIADQLWYPLWDAHLALDHSVRTVPQALRVAGEDLVAALGLLEARHIVGDIEVSNILIGGVRREWRGGISARFDDLIAGVRARWQRCGEIAHRAEPDLKNGRGGLRDAQLCDALAIAQLTNAMPRLGADPVVDGVARARRQLLDTRTEQHRVAGRAGDQLRVQDAAEVAAALDLGDRFDLAHVLSNASRTMSYAVDVGLRTAAHALPRRGLARLPRMPVRRPLDEGVVQHADEVVLARGARPERDPALVLRVAAASAQTGLPISVTTLERLTGTASALGEPWPKEALADLLLLLGAGRGVVDAVEALDRTGIWAELLPEWAMVRDLPPRDALHIWTVDRHLVETVAHAAALSTRVARPDLLLIGALLHDIGKGRPGDHCVVGAELATEIGHRFGLWPSDITTLAGMVRHHLLLPQTVVRRDLTAPETVHEVIEAVQGDVQLLELLHALTEADSLATGPGIWTRWKASLVGELVRRCRRAMAGDALPTPQPVDQELLDRAAAGGVHVELRQGEGKHTYTVTVIAPEARGLLFKAAGALALHALRVLSADLGKAGASAIDTFVVTPRFGGPPDPGLLRQDIVRAVAGEVDVIAALDRRERRAMTAGDLGYAKATPRVLWSQTSMPGQLVLQVRTEDRIGLLSRLAAALADCAVDVLWAQVITRGAAVVDVFCLDMAADSGEDRRSAIEQAVLAVVPQSAPTHLPSEAGQ